MTKIQIMAFIVAAMTFVKIIVVLVSPRAWFNNVTKKVWSSPTAVAVVSLALALLTLKFLLAELTIVHIWAVMLFVVAIMSLSLAPFSSYLLKSIEEWMDKEHIKKKGLLPLSIWVILSAWVLYELFA